MEKDGVTMLSIAAELSSRNDDTHHPICKNNNTTGGEGSPTAKASRRGSSANSSISSSPKSKLVLPDLTPDVRKDLESGRLSSADLPLSISKREEWLDYPLKGIAQPHPNDVLCGRGGGSNNHPGNEAFRLLVSEVKLPYVNCPKREKPLIARRVVEAVRNQNPPGRFLQKDNTTGLWNDIGDGRAREKTSQALREGAPVIRNMIDKTVENDVGVKGKKKRTSPVNDVEQLEKAVGCNLDDLEDKKQSQMHQNRAFQDFANPQLPLSLSMLKDRLKADRQDPMQSSNMMYQSRGEAVPDFSKMQQWRPNFKDVPSYPPPPSFRDDQSRFASGFAPAMSFPQHRRRATMDYAPTPTRASLPDSIPYETVRGLLLGHLDPVQLAYSILPPEDAAAVARLHLINAPNNNFVAAAPPAAPLPSMPLCSLVSDGSSSPSECTAKEENQLSDNDSSRQSNKPSVLPKKKRKFIE